MSQAGTIRLLRRPDAARLCAFGYVSFCPSRTFGEHTSSAIRLSLSVRDVACVGPVGQVRSQRRFVEPKRAAQRHTETQAE
jgi:hypothetical protein